MTGIVVLRATPTLHVQVSRACAADLCVFSANLSKAFCRIYRGMLGFRVAEQCAAMLGPQSSRSDLNQLSSQCIVLRSVFRPDGRRIFSFSGRQFVLILFNFFDPCRHSFLIVIKFVIFDPTPPL